MIEGPSNTIWNAQPAQRQFALLGCGGLVFGLVIGALLTILGLIALAPQPQPATPNPARTAGNLTITMDDVYLTQVVGSAVSQASLPISLSDVQVEILPDDRVKISGNARTLIPGTNQMVATAQIETRSGTLALHILSAKIGGLTLPAAITSALERAINAKLAEMIQELVPQGYTISGVSTTEHQLRMDISRQ